MSAYRISYSNEAIEQLEYHSNWYDSQEHNLWDQFLKSIWKTLSNISALPFWYKVTISPFREAPVKKFPFCITYEVKPNNVIIILAIFHTKQHPDTKLPS